MPYTLNQSFSKKNILAITHAKNLLKLLSSPSKILSSFCNEFKYHFCLTMMNELNRQSHRPNHESLPQAR